MQHLDHEPALTVTWLADKGDAFDRNILNRVPANTQHRLGRTDLDDRSWTFAAQLDVVAIQQQRCRDQVDAGFEADTAACVR